jgi:hypothetical protein
VSATPLPTVVMAPTASSETLTPFPTRTPSDTLIPNPTSPFAWSPTFGSHSVIKTAEFVSSLGLGWTPTFEPNMTYEFGRATPVETDSLSPTPSMTPPPTPTPSPSLMCPAHVFNVGDICVPRMKRPEEICRTILTLRLQYETGAAGPGLLEHLIPELLAKFTVGLDEEAVFDANRTMYATLGPDPRAPNDLTRNQGIFPRCGSPSCFENKFTSHGSDQVAFLHDQHFRAARMLDLARKLLNCNW